MSNWKKIPADDVPKTSTSRKKNGNSRIVSARLFTDIGWIVADIHVPSSVRLIDYLAHENPFLSLTSAFLERRDSALDFFALRKSTLSFLAVMDLEELASARSTGSQTRHNISCLVAEGGVTGDAEIHEGMRLSDYLARHRGFVLMYNSHFRIQDPLTHEVRSEADTTIILNSQKIIGLCEIPITNEETVKPVAAKESDPQPTQAEGKKKST